MNSRKYIHPFPARMAPDIAVDECKKLSPGSTILDPMCGSGTTLRAAQEANLYAIGSDLDPMAVLISKVNTTPLDPEATIKAAMDAVDKAKSTSRVKLPWIDDDKETQEFIDFWFAGKQVKDLRRIAHVIDRYYSGKLRDFLKITLSRIIITKEMRASLARDTSHSRPHRVALNNNYDIFSNFLKSAVQTAQRLPEPGGQPAAVSRRDARNLSNVASNSVDAVITSPPYLNAIDYMRGHKLALVWLGYKLSDLREVRSTSIGTERRPDDSYKTELLNNLVQEMKFYGRLKKREKAMFDRYALDVLSLMEEINRVIKSDGKAILVVGNSCLKDIFIKNTEAVIAAAQLVGLQLEAKRTRKLPRNSRYLPTPTRNDRSSLSKRMRTESVLHFRKPSLITP